MKKLTDQTISVKTMTWKHVNGQDVVSLGEYEGMKQLHQYCLDNKLTDEKDFDDFMGKGGISQFFEGDPDSIILQGRVSYFDCHTDKNICWLNCDVWEYDELCEILDRFWQYKRYCGTGYIRRCEDLNLHLRWDEINDDDETFICYRGGSGNIYDLYNYNEINNLLKHKEKPI